MTLSKQGASTDVSRFRRLHHALMILHFEQLTEQVPRERLRPRVKFKQWHPALKSSSETKMAA